jgi:hypothetical protein
MVLSRVVHPHHVSDTRHQNKFLIFDIEDIAFTSHTDGGKLKYSTPSMMDLHGVTYEELNTIEWNNYALSLMDYDDATQQIKILACGPIGPAGNCFISYSRAYTPLLYEISPRVVYSDSDISFWIDVRSA